MEQGKQAKGTHLEENSEDALPGGNYPKELRVAVLVQRFQCPQAEVCHLEELALGQIACEYRNVAEEWRFSTAELEGFLMKALEEHGCRTGK
jgi:hypothetical protein